MTLPATTLNGALTSGASSLTVRDAVGFPSLSASGPFKVLIDTEVLSVTAGHGTTTWTVARAQDGTTAAAHADGATVTLVPEAYATLDDVASALDSTPTNAKYQRLAALLEMASTELTREVGHDFYRSPRVSGTAVTFPKVRVSSAGDRLCVLGGFAAAPTLIRIADEFGASTYTSLAAAEWYVEALIDETYSYDHIYLGGLGTSGYTTWPTGHRRVELTVAEGFASIPPDVRESVVDRVKQLDNANPSSWGGVQGPEEFGRMVILPRKPDTWWSLVEKYRGRHGRAGCFL